MNKTGETCIRGCANVNAINRSINKLAELEDQFNNTAKVLNLAGNDTRLKILYLIRNENSVCVCDLSDILGISVSAISQQLKKLKNGGILNSKKEGQTIYYFITSDYKIILEQFFEMLNQELIIKVA